MSRDVRSQAPALRAPGGGMALSLAPSGDPQLAHLFRNMRAAMRLQREAIARRLATTPATIGDFENGAVSALPPWPETVRIVRGYCDLLRLDPEPLLWRIQQLQRGGNPDLSAAAPPDPLPLALRNAPARVPARERMPRRRGGGIRRLLMLAALPVAAAGVAYAAVLSPAVVYRAIALLPASMAGSARAGLDSIVLYAAPRRDGLRWIDVGDPRLRKGNKLPTKAR